MEDARTLVIDGVRLTLVEDFRELGRVLKAQENRGRWDILAVDQFMTAEISSFGGYIVLALYAEVNTDRLPEAIKEDPEVEAEFSDGKLTLKYYATYEYTGGATLIAIVNRINRFRSLLGRVLAELQHR
uniref:Uncharacterized protein n=1 Tax=Thermofilum pendens TaxID=2269 RepID=A0A7C3SLD2_THEPE